jgi:hypothetical protein
MRSNYLILKVTPGTDFPAVKKAYRKAVQRYHPDANGGVGNPEMFKLVVKAYREIQEHHRAMGIKPAVKKPFPAIEYVGSFLAKFGFSATQAASSDASREPVMRARRRKLYKSADVDPFLANLDFDELTLRLAASDNDMVKKLAARALAVAYRVDAIPVLATELLGASQELAEEIIFSLGLVDHRYSAEVLERYVRNKNVKVATSAVNALRNMRRSYAAIVLGKLVREGGSIRHLVRQLFGNRKDRKLVRMGILDKSEFRLASVLGSKTGQPIPVVLKELGWILPKTV